MLIERLRNLVDMGMPIEPGELSVLTEAADALELKSNLYDSELRHSEAMRQRVRQLEATLIEIGEQDLSTEGDLPGEGDYEYGYDEVVKLARKTLLPAGDSSEIRHKPWCALELTPFNEGVACNCQTQTVEDQGNG